jgi:hypothetical protein
VQRLPKPVVWIVMALLLMIAFIHLIVAPDMFSDATYKGLLFIVGAISALIAATGIQEGELVWGWGLGLLVAVVTVVGYIANSTIGLPGLPAEPDAWQEPLGVGSLVAAALLVLLAMWAFRATQRSSPRRASSLVH